MLQDDLSILIAGSTVHSVTTTDERPGSAERDRHRVILDYLQTVPGILTGLAGVLGAVTALLALLQR
jgi:hypothetical protein